MIKIDCVQDLPEWFDLDKYIGAEAFKAPEWLEQLRRRHELLELHPSRVNRKVKNNSTDWQKFIQEFWALSVKDTAEKIRRAPLDLPSSDKLIRWAAECSPVKFVCALDLLWQAERDIEAERNGIAPAGTSLRWTATNPQSENLKSIAAHGRDQISFNYYLNDDLNIPLVQVNLGATDSVLKAAFSKWLETAREKCGTEKPKRTSFYDRWARYGVLPYIDLWIWSMETQTHIPDRVMSAAISRYDSGEANLRKTIAPLAESLMRDISELSSLAAMEAQNLPEGNTETF